VFVLAFIHVASRRVILSPATFRPNEAWVQEQAESFVDQARAQGLKPEIAQHDRDTKFSKAVDRTLRRKRVVVKISEFRAPNTNAFVERFIQSIQQECLDGSSSSAAGTWTTSAGNTWSTTTPRGLTRGLRMNWW
jgi:putative transposase